LLRIQIDRESPDPLHLQIYAAIRDAIGDGSLKAGTRIPSTRTLALRLDVSRNTVLAAYEMLALEGLLVSRIGSGTRVCKTHPDAPCVPSPPALHASTLLRQSQYPANPAVFEDPDGNLLYAHR
jgi:GntR family transcriptional regulator/MocR family aminotransferase